MSASLVVLDMVGTTVRAGEEIPDTFRRVLGEEGVELSDESLRRVRGRSKREAIAALLAPGAGSARDSGRVETVYQRFQEQLRHAYRSRAAEIPGAERVLRTLIKKTAVVLTTGLDRTTAAQLLETLGWESLGLAGVLTGDDVAWGRPAPDLILAAMQEAGTTDASSVVVVGDTVSDLEAAAAAGVGWSVGVLSGAHSRSQLESRPHSVILESVADLPDWLRGVGALA